MRCQYCHTLIVHRFSGEYTERDRAKRHRHERYCDENPDAEDEPTPADLLSNYRRLNNDE